MCKNNLRLENRKPTIPTAMNDVFAYTRTTVPEFVHKKRNGVRISDVDITGNDVAFKQHLLKNRLHYFPRLSFLSTLRSSAKERGNDKYVHNYATLFDIKNMEH